MTKRIYTCDTCGSEYQRSGDASNCCRAGAPHALNFERKSIHPDWRTADRVDGYDRDNTGESNDY
jgi:hypothetical protein